MGIVISIAKIIISVILIITNSNTQKIITQPYKVKILERLNYSEIAYHLGGNLGLISFLLNSYIAEKYEIYTDDDLGRLARILDSSTALASNSSGLFTHMFFQLSGYRINEDLSKGSNCFFYDNVDFISRNGRNCGIINVIKTSGFLKNGKWIVQGNNDSEIFLTNARHELYHTWQIRFGGSISLVVLVIETVVTTIAESQNLMISYPYNISWTMEGKARIMSEWLPKNYPGAIKPFFTRSESLNKFY